MTSLSSSFRWSFFGEFFSKILPPLSFLILAILLTPEDFGVMSSALMVIAFSQIFWEAGLNKAIVQSKNITNSMPATAFWINIVFGLTIAALLFFFSGLIAESIFNDYRVEKVLRYMTLYVFFASIASCPLALMQKEMQFKKLFYVRLFSSFVPFIVSIPFALIGYGYMSLVFGSIVGQGVQIFVIYIVFYWKPSFLFSFSIAKDLINFGKWVFLTAILGWFFMWADSLIVAIYTDTETFGIYRVGSQIATMFFAVLIAPLSPVINSLFSSESDNKDLIEMKLSELIKLLIMVCIPISFIIFFNVEAISDYIFTDKWGDLGFIISIMILMNGFSWIVGMNGDYYRAIGKPNYETIVNLFFITLYIFTYIVTIKISFDVFIWSRLIVSLLAMICHFFLFKKLSNTKVLGNIYLIILVSFFSIVTCYSFNFLVALILQNEHDLINSILSSILSLLVFFLFIFLNRDKLTKSFNLLKQ